MLLGRSLIQQLLQRVLDYSTADETEVVFSRSRESLTRFANSYIHQNMTEENVYLSVRSVLGKQVGVASTNQMDDASLRAVVERAVTIARWQPENPAFPGLPKPEPVAECDAVVEATAACPPERRAEAVRTICQTARSHRLHASGAFATGLVETAVANSHGVFAYHPSTQASLTTVMLGDNEAAGYADMHSRHVEEIAAEWVAKTAAEKAARSASPVHLDPGEYEVILEEPAVDDMLGFLAYYGFNGLAHLEGRSFTSQALGTQVVGQNITLWDDGHDPRGFPLPFDYEGVPRRALPLFETGIARNVVYDSYTAARAQQGNTGHALPAPNTWGPAPLHLRLEPGTHDQAAMLRSVKRGIWVTRFWYTNVIHPTHLPHRER